MWLLHYTTLLYPENSCFFTLHDTKTKFIGHIDNAFLNIAMCHFCAESLLPWQQRAYDKAQNLSFFGHFKNPFAKLFLVF
jgi:hypothetical protein